MLTGSNDQSPIRVGGVIQSSRPISPRQ